MILKHKHIVIFKTDNNNNIIYNKNGTPKRNNLAKRTEPLYEIKCDKCGNIFTEKASIFDKRLKLINKEYCGKCSRSLMSSISGLKGSYDKDNNLKPNSGRFTSEKVKNLSVEDYEIYCKQRKKASNVFHKKLRDDEEYRKNFYEKVYKNSKIGYISKGQRELFNELEEHGFELEKNIEGLNVDMVNVDMKLIFEYYGDYFHANPKLYKSDDYIDVIKMTSKEKWEKDRKRNFVLINKGYHIVIIWENQWKNNREKVFDKIQKYVIDYDIPHYKKEETKRKWMNDGTINKTILNEYTDSYLEDGWVFGRLKRK